tara:strand:+ start:592 stop:1707 length:1116 start_codon:yes stop_codon:yes gene_type:complete
MKDRVSTVARFDRQVSDAQNDAGSVLATSQYGLQAKPASFYPQPAKTREQQDADVAKDRVADVSRFNRQVSAAQSDAVPGQSPVGGMARYLVGNAGVDAVKAIPSADIFNPRDLVKEGFNSPTNYGLAGQIYHGAQGLVNSMTPEVRTPAPSQAPATATATKPVEAPAAKAVAPIAEKVAANPATAPGNGTPSASGGMRYQGHKVIPWYNEQDYRMAAYQDGKGPDYDSAQAQMVAAKDGGAGGRTQVNADRAYEAKVAETQDGIYKDAQNEIFGGINQSTGKPVPGDAGAENTHWFDPPTYSAEGQEKSASTLKRHASRLGVNQGALDQNRYEFSPDGVVKMYHLNDKIPFSSAPVNQSLKLLQALAQAR